MLAYIYRSPKKDEMYLYVAQKDDFSNVPQALMARFGTPQWVMALDLATREKLAREDIDEVRANLESQGYHLQLPPPPEKLVP
ncbi:MAG: YcgL domain-containing protein [Gammaproteobacteria bacterium]|nr:MAG: YcgL domain-containing protein [Gammaproteobacteria bacterium]